MYTRPSDPADWLPWDCYTHNNEKMVAVNPLVVGACAVDFLTCCYRFESLLFLLLLGRSNMAI